MSLALNPVAFNLGPIQVKWYGILMATGVLVATLMAINEGKKDKLCLMTSLISFFGQFQLALLVRESIM